MNSDYPEGKGGANIQPSARKSIHSYRNNQLRPDESMARYGLNQHSNQNDRDNSHSKHTDKDQGKDVVDNVMSKFSRQTSPLSIRKPTKILRTNSYSQDEEGTDDNINVLSKSLPATLPSHLSYSTDSDLEEPNFSTNSRTRSRINESEDEINQSLSMNWSNRSSQQLPPSPFSQKLTVPPRDKILPQSQSGSHSYIIWLTVLVGIIAAVYLKFPNVIITKNHDKSTQTLNHDKIIFENNMNELQEKYNIDDNSILKLKTGISTIFSRMDTGSFMFVYNSKTINFNPVHFEKFTDEVAYTTARYLRNDISSIQHTVIESSNLDMQEHGELITRYRDDVDRSGVLLVKEVDAVPSDLAMAFHYYCDEYEPLVKRSAIFFTLNMANCSNTSSDIAKWKHIEDFFKLDNNNPFFVFAPALTKSHLNPNNKQKMKVKLAAQVLSHTVSAGMYAKITQEKRSMHDFIERCLTKKWKTVPPENMRPLLTRVVDIIIDVSSIF